MCRSDTLWTRGRRSALVVVLGALAGCEDAKSPSEVPHVVFVCEHGTVKSVMAARLFNAEALRRGLPHRAVARGLAAGERVPRALAKAMRADGFDVEEIESARLSYDEASRALRVVTIGAVLPGFDADTLAPVERWDDVPPASVDYHAARAALAARVEALLDRLEPGGRRQRDHARR
jgi:protein-tyrosine-phosphatase